MSCQQSGADLVSFELVGRATCTHRAPIRCQDLVSLAEKTSHLAADSRGSNLNDEVHSPFVTPIIGYFLNPTEPHAARPIKSVAYDLDVRSGLQSGYSKHSSS